MCWCGRSVVGVGCRLRPSALCACVCVMVSRGRGERLHAECRRRVGECGAARGVRGLGPGCQGYVWLVLLCFALRLCFPVLLSVVVCCDVVLCGYVVLCVLCRPVLCWLASLRVTDGAPPCG